MWNAEVEKQKPGAGDKQQVTRDRHKYCLLLKNHFRIPTSDFS